MMGDGMDLSIYLDRWKEKVAVVGEIMMLI